MNDYPLLEKNHVNSLPENRVVYIYGLTGLLAMQKDGVVYYLLKDHLGSTRVLVDETDTVAAYYDYAPFGNLMRFDEDVEVSYKFTAQEFDSESGLHNFRARLYDSDLGRFYAVDAAGQTPSPYLYADNNPVIYVDEDGRLFGIDDLLVSGLAFISSYFYHGITTGDFGKDALVSAAIAAGSAWLAYNTGGAAAGLLFSEGSAGYVITSSAVGGAVGSFTSNVGYQAYYNNGNIDLNLAWNAAVEGFGGGLVSGFAESSIIRNLGKFPGHHLTKHAIRSTSYEIGSNLFADRAVFKNLSFGADASAIFPGAGDIVYTTSPLWKDYAIDKVIGDKLPDWITKENISHLDIEFGIVKDQQGNQRIIFFTAETNALTLNATLGRVRFKNLRINKGYVYSALKPFTSLELRFRTKPFILNPYYLNFIYFWR